MALKELLAEFEKKKNPEKAKLLSGFFKTGKGQYGEGDVFLGLTVPEQRELAKKYKGLDLADIQKLIDSKIHEHRLTGLIILVYKYEDSDREKNEIDKKKIFDFYLKNTKKVNNWDLVDVTCHRIVGAYLEDKERSVLYKFANSTNLWEKRIAIVSTAWFIKNKDFKDTLKLSEILLKDNHDLIHKAVGWMLREVGKKDEKTLKGFLDKNHKVMPRTMLRYSLERLSEKDKKHYMKK
ncbi:MAG: DNA alkylation repair protein [Candidatus Nanoarchaeia archaeon]